MYMYMYVYLCRVLLFRSFKQVLHGRSILHSQQSHYWIILHRDELLHELSVELPPRAVWKVTEEKEAIFVDVFSTRCDALHGLDTGLEM